MKEATNEIRADILRVEATVLSLKSTIIAADLSTREGVPTGALPADRGEMLANVTLAYRHLEDARMRLGKVIQAYDGGVSVYDRKPANQPPPVDNAHVAEGCAQFAPPP